MRCNVLPIIFKTGLFTGVAAVIAIVAVVLALTDAAPVLIQSQESKTGEDRPVFNRISFQPGRDRDVWMMQQSHQGLTGDADLWDRIAIVVQHDARRTAEFYQLEPGALVFDQDEKAVAKKAQCFMCHPNGPRAIRPDQTNSQVKLTRWDRFRVQIWNLRIKTYGRVVAPVQNLEADFRMQSKPANELLTVTACTRCHSDDGLVRRGHLTKQNFMAIDFMLRNNLMPPPGFFLDEKDRQVIQQFIGKS